MTHNEKRGHWLKEGAIGLSTGILYGMTSVAVGHPFDTIKTKMQAQSGYLEGGGTFSALAKIWRAEGMKGLYRGWFPPLWGSGLYRSTQFAVYEALYTKWDANRAYASPYVKADSRPNLNTAIPFTAGVETRVLSAAFVASLSRAVIECPSPSTDAACP
jgi:solute carrier family 25 carnitine/acylcarnitine transporter 20/29